jgi:SnoaL-like domain
MVNDKETDLMATYRGRCGEEVVIWVQYCGSFRSSPTVFPPNGTNGRDCLVCRLRVNFWDEEGDGVKRVFVAGGSGVMGRLVPQLLAQGHQPPHFGALRYVGADNKRRAWQEAFATFTGPFDYEIHELNVTTEAALAFVHSLNHVKAMLASGQITELWLRWTACLRRIDGVWLIVHDHVSVPADLEHGQAVVNLRP